MRAFACTTARRPHYSVIYVVRYDSSSSIDVPCPPWFTGELQSTIFSCDTILSDRRNRGTPILYRTFATPSRGRNVSNDALGTARNGPRWNGNIIILRCSQDNPNRFVNMRTGDSRRAVQVLHRYASLDVVQ